VTNYAYTRSKGIFNPDNSKPVNIIGCGSIGSFAALALAKMGIKRFYLFDDDIVGEENIGCQNFGWEHIGKPKVEALKEILLRNAPLKEEEIVTFNERVTDSTRLPKVITIVGVDNMLARKIVWHKLKGRIPLLIDGRIGGQAIRVFSVEKGNKEQEEYYEKYLISDEKAVEAPCTQRNVIYVANFVQGLVARAVRNFIELGKTEKEVGIEAESLTMYIEE